jgi:hypothetical protein
VLDRDQAFQREVCNVAQSVAITVGQLRSGWLSKPDAEVRPVRPK